MYIIYSTSICAKWNIKQVSISPSVCLSADGQGLQTHGDCSFLLTEAGRDAGKESPQCFRVELAFESSKGGGSTARLSSFFFFFWFVCLTIPLTVVKGVMDLVKKAIRNISTTPFSLSSLSLPHSLSLSLRLSSGIWRV